MSKNVLAVEFDEVQKKAMASALMALAEEVANNSTQEPWTHGETIDLFSDSDSNSNCELLGSLDVDATEPPGTVMKVEVEDRCVGNGAASTTTSNGLHAASMPVAISPKISNHSQRYEVPALVPFAPPPFARSVLDGLESLPANTFVTLVDLGAQELRVEECDATGAFEFESTKHKENVMLPKLDPNAESSTVECATTTLVSRIYKLKEEQEALQASTDDGTVVGDTRFLAATFNTDRLEWSESDINEETLEPVTRGSDDTSNKMITDDDEIISLDSSDNDNDDDDEMVGTKLISLLESSSDEASNDEASNDGEQSKQSEQKIIDRLVQYYCPVCNLKCGPLHKWKAHTDSAHGFQSVAKLNLRTVIDREGSLCYQCKVCNRKFATDTNFARLLKHRIMHTPHPYYYKCRLCDKTLKTLCAMKLHLRQVHAKLGKYIVPTERFRKYIEFHCPVCNEILASYEYWKYHLDVKHDFNEQLAKRVRPVRDRIVACMDCDKEFNKRSIMVHMMAHQPYRCFHCKLCKECENNALARCVAHIRQAHFQGGGRKYKCSYCSAEFNVTSERNHHMKDKHHTQRVHCEVCQKSFATAAMLLSHMNLKNHQKLK